MILYFVCVLNSENDLYISKQCLNSKTEDFNYNLEFSQFLSEVHMKISIHQSKILQVRLLSVAETAKYYDFIFTQK